MGSEVADWALLYARFGFRSFPVKAAGKAPIFSGWQKDATTDSKLIHQYWRPGSDRNLGLVTGETMDAWDIEGDHIARFSEYMYGHGVTIPDAPVATTGRGGIHILTAPTGVDGTRRLYLDGTHIGELKSRGGFIVACPSETEGQYLWVNLPLRPVPDAPQWLLDLLERPKTVISRRTSRITALAEIQPRLEALGRSIIAVKADHKRNEYLFWAVITAVEEGVPDAIAAEAMFDAYMSASLPGENESERRREAQKTIESALHTVAA